MPLCQKKIVKICHYTHKNQDLKSSAEWQRLVYYIVETRSAQRRIGLHSGGSWRPGFPSLLPYCKFKNSMQYTEAIPSNFIGRPYDISKLWSCCGRLNYLSIMRQLASKLLSSKVRPLFIHFARENGLGDSRTDIYINTQTEFAIRT